MNNRQISFNSRKIVFVGAPDTQIVDVAGPSQIFVRAAELFMQQHASKASPYTVTLASTSSDRRIRTNCGLSIEAHYTYRSVRGPVDTLLVVGGTGLDQAAKIGCQPWFYQRLKAYGFVGLSKGAVAHETECGTHKA